MPEIQTNLYYENIVPGLRKNYNVSKYSSIHRLPVKPFLLDKLLFSSKYFATLWVLLHAVDELTSLSLKSTLRSI